MPLFAKTLIALAVISVLGLLAVKGPEKFKQRRIETLLDDAGTALSEQKWKRSSKLARSAFELDRDNVRSIRMARNALLGDGDPRALRYAELAAESSEREEQDLVILLELLLQTKQMGFAQQAIRELTEHYPSYQGLSYLQSVCFAYSGASRQAITSLRQQPGDPKSQLLLGNLLLTQRDPALQLEGIRLLLDRVRIQDDWQMQAIQLLTSVKIPFEEMEDFPALEDLIPDRDDFNASDRLSLASLEINRHPERRFAVIEEACRRYGHEDVITLVPWLSLHQQHHRVLDILSVRNPRNSKAVFSSHLSALLNSDQLDQAMALLESPPESFSKVQALAIQASIASQQGNTDAKQLLWRKALYQADLDPSGYQMATLGELALRASETTVAVQAMRKAIQRPVAKMLSHRQYSSLLPLFYKPQCRLRRSTGPVQASARQESREPCRDQQSRLPEAAPESRRGRVHQQPRYFG